MELSMSSIALLGPSGTLGAGPLAAGKGVGGVRASNNYFAAIGDSRTYESTDATLLLTKQNRGHPFWAEFLSNGAAEFRPEWNYGVNGNTSEQMLARVADVTTTVGTVVIFISTNDRSAGWTAQRSIDAISAARDFFVARGQAVVLIAESPRGDAANPSLRLDSTQLAYARAVRDWCVSQDRIKSTRAVNAWPLLEDGTTGDVKAGYTRDGLHGTVLMGHAIGSLLAPVLVEIMPSPDLSLFSPLAYPSGAWQGDNPQLTGTGGSLGAGGSGVMATSWGGLPSTSETGLLRNYTDQKTCVVSGTPNTATPSLFLWRSNQLVSRFAGGDIVEAGCDLSWLASLTSFRNVQFTLELAGDTSYSYIIGARTASDVVDMPAGAMAGRMRLRGVIPANPTSVRLYLATYHRQSIEALGTLIANNIGIRKVA